MPVYKATNEVQGIGIVGYACFTPSPPPNNPLRPSGPEPPQPGTPPPSPPNTPPATIDVETYQDSNGDCWRILTWRYGSALQPRVEKIPIDCADL